MKVPSVSLRDIATALTVVLLCGSLAGCAVVKPFVPPPEKLTVESSPAPTDEYDAVVRMADALRAEVLKKRKSLYNFDFWSGSILLGAGLAGAGLGLYGGSYDAIVGTALGAGAVVGGRTYVSIGTRKGIYNDALKGIESAKTGTLEMSPSTTDTFSKLMASFNGAPSLKDTPPHAYVLFMAAAANAEALSTSLAAFNAPANRANNLRKALQNIVLTANEALVNQVLDPSAALTAATQHIKTARQNVAALKQEADGSVKALKLVERFEELNSQAKSSVQQTAFENLKKATADLKNWVDSVHVD